MVDSKKKNDRPNSKDLDYVPTWENRRKLIIAILVFLAVLISYITWQATLITTAVGGIAILDTIVTMAFALAFSVIGFYVGGVAWQDVSIIKAISTIKQAQNTESKTKTKKDEVE